MKPSTYSTLKGTWMKTRRPVSAATIRQLASALLIPVLLLVTISANAQLERISIADDGGQANGGSSQAAISIDGSVVAFHSTANNLVSGDTNGWGDVFVRDLDAGTTEIVSLRPDGGETQKDSQRPSLSDDGSLVAFQGRNPADLTVPALTDQNDGTTVHLLPDSSGSSPSAATTARLESTLSGDGRFLAFRSRSSLQGVWPASMRPVNDDQNSAHDVFVLDLETEPTPPLERVSRLSTGDELDTDSRSPAVSHDGRFVAFMTYSELLVNDANGRPDIVIKDRQSGALEIISVTPGNSTGNAGSFNPALSADANIVVFRSEASDLVPGDTNGRWDIFVRDRSAGTTSRVSVASDGTQANHNSFEASVSDDGRFVAFRSLASNLVADDTNNRANIFVHDRDTGQTAIVSRPAGGQADGHSANPVLSGDGQWIAFESDATNLVPEDTNQVRDIFRVANPFWSAP